MNLSSVEVFKKSEEELKIEKMTQEQLIRYKKYKVVKDAMQRIANILKDENIK